MYFATTPSPDLLVGHGSGCIPQRIASVVLEPVLSSDGKDGKKQLGSKIDWVGSRQVDNWQMLVEPAYVSIEKSRQGMPRGEDEVVGQNG